MKVAILAQYPVHLLSGVRLKRQPSGHFATWFPQLSYHFKQFSDLELHWIAFTPYAETAQEISEGNQRFHILPTAGSKRATTLFAADRRKVKAILDNVSPQIVHGWGTEDVYGFAAVTSGLPNIVSFQGILTAYALRTRMQPREYFQALLEMFILFRANWITVESAWGEKLIRRRNPLGKISIVEYGVQNLFFETKWAPESNRPAAVFVGSISARKGINDLVTAFSDPRLLDAELWVVGSVEGWWAEELCQSSPPNVHWLGHLSASETAAKLAKAWCLALPTRADTSPNAVKEARVIGLPVVTTPCGGQSTYVIDGETGYVIPPGDVASLADKLSLVLSDFNRCRTLGSKLHQEHREALDPRLTATKFASLYRQLAKA